jgi:eukaryotic-like serine/threonine-protein kinase
MSDPASGRGGGAWQGMRLGRYDLIAQLGSGGMADVYLGVVRGPAGFNKLVVLKVLRSRFVNDAEFLKMFLDEARLAARFNHPNVVQTFEVEEDFGRHFLVMEYLEGHPLADFDDGQGDLPLPAAVRVLADVLSGLHYAHGLTDLHGQPLGVVHRDVSPQNVFVTYDGPAKLLDFGVAKVKNALSQTQDGAIKGKVRYMAPEQVNGEEIDHRVDLFAAGILLWRAATGKKLWSNLDQLAIMHRLVSGEPVPAPRSVRADVPPAVDAICEKALALRPDDRYQTAAEFAVALEEYLHDEGAAGSHRAVARALDERYAADRAKFRSFVDERLRSLEGLPVDRASGVRRGDAEAVSSQRPGFGVLVDFPAANTSVRPLPMSGSLPSSVSAVGALPRPPRRSWPFVSAAVGVGVAASAIAASVALRSAPGPAKPGASVALTAPASAPSALAAEAPREPATPVASTAPPPVTSTTAPPVASTAPRATGEAPPEGDALPGDRATKGRGKGRNGGYKGPRPEATAAAPPPTAEPPPPRPSIDPCASPYYIDERGVKKVKRECL